jgi:hypothetical protein
VTLFDSDANILGQKELAPRLYPSPPRELARRRPGVRSRRANIHEGGMLEGQMRRVVMFPDDGHPDLSYHVADLTGDSATKSSFGTNAAFGFTRSTAPPFPVPTGRSTHRCETRTITTPTIVRTCPFRDGSSRHSAQGQFFVDHRVRFRGDAVVDRGVVGIGHSRRLLFRIR